MRKRDTGLSTRMRVEGMSRVTAEGSSICVLHEAAGLIFCPGGCVHEEVPCPVQLWFGRPVHLPMAFVNLPCVRAHVYARETSQRKAAVVRNRHCVLYSAGQRHTFANIAHAGFIPPCHAGPLSCPHLYPPSTTNTLVFTLARTTLPPSILTTSCARHSAYIQNKDRVGQFTLLPSDTSVTHTQSYNVPQAIQSTNNQTSQPQ